MKQQQREAVFWHALKSIAGKQAERSNLPAGEKVGLALTINGQLAGAEVARVVQCRASIGHPGTKPNSAAVDPAKLLAYLLSQLGPRKRLQMVDQVLRAHAAGEFDQLDEALVETCEQTLKQLRTALDPKPYGASVSISNCEVSKAA